MDRINSLFCFSTALNYRSNYRNLGSIQWHSIFSWLLLLSFASWGSIAVGAEKIETVKKEGQQTLSFSRDVVPVLTKAGCNAGACHGSFQGRGGMSLSLLGYDTVADFEALFQAGRGRRVTPTAADRSLLLRKATGSVPHGGGALIKKDSESFQVLGEYIKQGMSPAKSDDPRVIKLTVEPASLVLAPGQSRSLKVVADWEDGVHRDITRWALFDSQDSQIVEVSSSGQIAAVRSGKSPVTVRFLGQVASVDVTVPYNPAKAITGFTPSNYVDQLVLAEWQRMGVSPAPTATDSEFLRRVYLDLIGSLPQPDEVRTFIESTDKNKRKKIIDALLERPEYVDYWSLKWSDLLRVHRRYVGDKGLETFRGWIRRSIRENRPLDEMARELIVAQGDLFSNGPVGFYFIDQKPEELAETTAQVFLGIRMQCARCHHHPLEVWGQEDYYGLAAFFTHMQFKDAGKIGVRFGGPKSLRPTIKANTKRKLEKPSEARVLGGPVVSDQDLPDIRQPLADWIVSPKNPYFARSFVNRYWAWLTGRGIVEPVDDMRATNPPSNPALMNALTEDFIAHQFDVKHLLRTICNSRVYQLASDLKPERDKSGRLFTHRVPRRMQAEVLLDAVNQFAGTTERFNGQPPGTRAIALPDPQISSYFLMAFGRPLRNSACECARGSKPDLAQALHLVNGYAMNSKALSNDGRLGQLLKENKSDAEILDELYLASLSRKPTADEFKAVRELLAEAPSRKEGWQDLVWTIINLSEFVFNH
ncbi:DUF1549 and DUF1553 domain-containing protein [Gimesia aquarii]|uniref:Cytochrome c domain-containing protein n=1 Tax=Gimesia aquarii TaxID=2527964 RepID=A0A517WWU3_9PLAN|nr:DUF1549 and DUF1553 domain-containing protein [Gimesia aquarii]QDU09672.1 hypothetical protein V202x_30480 [Gimesia aquarii]